VIFVLENYIHNDETSLLSGEKRDDLFSCFDTETSATDEENCRSLQELYSY